MTEKVFVVNFNGYWHNTDPSNDNYVFSTYEKAKNFVKKDWREYMRDWTEEENPRKWKDYLLEDPDIKQGWLNKDHYRIVTYKEDWLDWTIEKKIIDSEE